MSSARRGGPRGLDKPRPRSWYRLSRKAESKERITEKRPGLVCFTATSWGQLLRAKKMPPGETPPTAADAYRFVLSNPAVDVCMSAARTAEQMRQNLSVLDGGPMTEAELERMRRIGDFIYRPKRPNP